MNWERFLDGNLERHFLGNSFEHWLTAAFVMAGIFLLSVTVRAFAISHLRKSQAILRIDTVLPDLVERTQIFFLFLLAVHFGTQSLDLPPKLDSARDHIFLFVLFFQLGLWLTGALAFYGRRSIQDNLAKDSGRATTISSLITLGNIVIWVTMGLLLLENYGKNVSALITGLGIGGVAVAFALQNILGDLFASVSIALDKPFAIGDTISVNGLSGTVEQIGLKTTRIRSISGEQLIFSNSDLLKNVLRNYKRMERRRATFNFGLVYETPAAKLNRVRDLVKAAVSVQPQATFERCHLSSFGDSALNFEVVYWMETSDYNAYVEAQHHTAVAMLEAFQKEGIEFAYPTHVQIQRQ
jgi:small-conductance mechanosensitive channel